jgi:hypothetical protein
MGTTTNYNWPIPEDTDLVKDGAKAIRDLGNAIDTSAEDFAGGLVHINTTSFSAVSSQSINDVFSASFDYYRIIISWFASTNAALTMRLRVAGSDNNSANYDFGSWEAGSGGAGGNASLAAQTSFRLSSDQTTSERAQVSIDLANPFNVINTSYTSLANTRSSSFAYVSISGGRMTVDTSYTGFTILPSTGNITGKLSVWGYKA